MTFFSAAVLTAGRAGTLNLPLMFKRAVSSKSWCAEEGIVAPGWGCIGRLISDAIILRFSSTESESFVKASQTRFLDYQSVRFGGSGNSSSPLADQNQVIAPHQSLCL
jgi:hypothetical protein